MYRWTQMDTVSQCFSSERLDLICVCVCVCVLVYNTMHSIKCVLWFVSFTPFFLSFFSHPGLPRMQPGGLLSLPEFAFTSKRGRERGEKRTKQRLWVCMCVRVAVSVWVHLMFVCVGKGELGEEKKKKKSTWPADKAAFSKYSNKEKNNMPGYLPAPKPAPPSIHGKQKQHCQR